MTDQEVLERAIQKAIDSGWTVFSDGPVVYENCLLGADAISGMPTVTISVVVGGRVYGFGAIPLFNVIFNHDFAKSLFGDERISHYCEDGGVENEFLGGTLEYPYNEGADMQFTCGSWKVRLMEMVISPDPIKYLGSVI